MTTKTWYKIFYTIVRPFVGLYYPMKFIGKENIPEGGALVCANHSSAIDPFFLAFALGKKRPICAMAKESLMGIPVIGKILKLVGTFGVKRGASDIHAVKHAMEQLKKGRICGVVPGRNPGQVERRRGAQDRGGYAGLPDRRAGAAGVYSHPQAGAADQPGVYRPAPAFFPGGKTGLQSGI